MMSVWSTAGVLACLLAVPVSAGQAPLQRQDDAPMSLMTDRPEYCAQLAAQVVALQKTVPGPHPDVDMLIREGTAQCSAGHVKRGVHRLRTALVQLGGG